jgi:hypothetical protein
MHVMMASTRYKPNHPRRRAEQDIMAMNNPTRDSQRRTASRRFGRGVEPLEPRRCLSITGLDLLMPSRGDNVLGTSGESAYMGGTMESEHPGTSAVGSSGTSDSSTDFPDCDWDSLDLAQNECLSSDPLVDDMNITDDLPAEEELPGIPSEDSLIFVPGRTCNGDGAMCLPADDGSNPPVNDQLELSVMVGDSRLDLGDSTLNQTHHVPEPGYTSNSTDPHMARSRSLLADVRMVPLVRLVAHDRTDGLVPTNSTRRPWTDGLPGQSANPNRAHALLNSSVRMPFHGSRYFMSDRVESRSANWEPIAQASTERFQIFELVTTTSFEPPRSAMASSAGLEPDSTAVVGQASLRNGPPSGVDDTRAVPEAASQLPADLAAIATSEIVEAVLPDVRHTETRTERGPSGDSSTEVTSVFFASTEPAFRRWQVDTTVIAGVILVAAHYRAVRDRSADDCGRNPVTGSIVTSHPVRGRPGNGQWNPARSSPATA